MNGVLLILIGAAIFFFSRKQSMAGPKIPVNSQFLAEQFPGYQARPSEFFMIGGQLHRVNRDGKVVNLKQWDFDDNTGEFLLVTKREGSRIVVNTMPYNQRLTLWMERGGKGALSILMMAVFGGSTLLCITGANYIGAATPSPENVTYVAGMPWVLRFVGAICALGTFGFYRLARPWFDERLVVGPEPLRRATDDFGPSTATTSQPGSSEPSVDLSYRPSV